LVLIVTVRIVVSGAALNRVLSVGLFVVILMYCALATDVNPANTTTENSVVKSRLSMM